MSNDRTNPSLSDETLAAYALGDLGHQDRQAVDAALAHAPAARARLAKLQSLAGTLARTTLHEPPMTLLQQALRLVSTPVRRPTWLSRAADMVATVLFDSLATPAPMGLRSAGLAEARHMTFDSGLGEVDVEVRPAGPSSFRVTGQIAATQAGPIEVGFCRPGTPEEGTAEVDELGRFGFEVSKGEWEIRFNVAGRVCALPRILAG